MYDGSKNEAQIGESVEKLERNLKIYIAWKYQLEFADMTLCDLK